MLLSFKFTITILKFPRIQLEEYTIQQRLGGRRDSAAQISTPPNISPPTGNQCRRRSSLAQITEILKEWSSGGSKRTKQLSRRETLADLGRSIQGRFISDKGSTNSQFRKRRESSADGKMSNSSNNPEFIRNWVQERQDSIILNDSMMKSVSIHLI